MAEQQAFYITNLPMGIGVVILLFAIFYYIGWSSARKTANTGDLYAAGFTIGPVTNALAMASTWASLATFMGLSGLILALKAPFVFLWIQWAVSIPLIVILYGTTLRRMQVYTPASFIKTRYGSSSTLVIGGWMILTMIMYALGQMIGLGQAFEILFGIPYFTALIIAGLATVGFVTLGGMLGASYNAAFQMVVMTLALIAPMGAIMKAMGSSGWWFPPLAYGDMVPAMLAAVPDFFSTHYDFRWYFALIPAFTLGPIALPHLAMRVFTATSVKSARWAVVYFNLFLGLLFSGGYIVGFAGNYYSAISGTAIAKPDQIVFILNVIYNPEWVTAFVVGGALAAGLSTVAGNLMAIAALVGHDLLGIIAPNMDAKKKLRIGYVALASGGIIAILLAFNPPAFLVTSILWAFGLLASTVTPAILLGVWWKEANRLALIISSVFCGVLYIVVSPYVLPAIKIGTGVTANLGMASGLVTIPLSFAMFIILSVVFNRIPALASYAPTEEDKRLIDRIHGWGDDYDPKRYASVFWPLAFAAGCIAVFFWGLVPW